MQEKPSQNVINRDENFKAIHSECFNGFFFRWHMVFLLAIRGNYQGDSIQTFVDNLKSCDPFL